MSLNATWLVSDVLVWVFQGSSTLYPSFNGCFQQNKMPCHKSSQTFFKHDSEFAVLKWPPRSPNLSSIVQLWNVVEQESHIKDVQLVCIQCILQAMLSNTNLPLLLGKPRGAPREQSIYLVPQSLDQSNTSISMKSSAQPDKKKQNNKNTKTDIYCQ